MPDCNKPPDLSANEILAGVKGSFWKSVLFYKSVDSTNEIAASLAIKKGLETGAVIIADMQEKGRGRLGRKWVSPPGLNIYISIVLKPEIKPRDATLLTILTSVACAKALRGETGLNVAIKWPNDLTVSDKKIGGILTEVRSAPDKIKVAVIGIGINVNIEGMDFPMEIRDIAASVKSETGKCHSRGLIIIRLLKEFEYWHNTFTIKGRLPLLQEWKKLSTTMGKNVTVTTGKETISGLAEEIDDEGMLILRLPSGALKRISAGDLTILR